MPHLASRRLDRSDKLLYGGHAPGHLREAFRVSIEEDDDLVLEDFWEREGKQAWWDALDAGQRRSWLYGRLWNCTDTLPSDLRSAVRDRLDEPPPPWRGLGSYGAAVQALARQERARAAQLRRMVDF